MLTQTQFESLKRGSTGVDAEKSASRIIEAFKKASKTQKDEISALSGITKFSFYKGTSSAKAVLSIAQVMAIPPDFLTGESDNDDFTEDMLIEFYNKHTTGEKAKAFKTASEKPKKERKSSKKKVAEVPESVDSTVVAEEVPVVEETEVETVEVPEESVVKEVSVLEETEESVAVSEEPEVEEVAVSEETEVEIVAILEETEVPVSPKVDVPEINVETLEMLLRALSVRAKYSDEAETTYNAVVELLIK